MENLSAIRQVVTNDDGTVKRIKAAYDGKEAWFDIVGGKPKRFSCASVPWFEIPSHDYGKLRHQIEKIIRERREFAELVRDVRKPNWIADLSRCGVIVLPNGQVGINRWHEDRETHERKAILQKVRDIDAAVRMQDHIMENYGQGIVVAENGLLSHDLSALLRKFSIIQPCIEMRHALLIHANLQMEHAVKDALVMLAPILKKTAPTNQERRGELADDIAKLAFFLKNQWALPYRETIESAMENLRNARRAAGWFNRKNNGPADQVAIAGKKIETIQLNLLAVKGKLNLLINRDNRPDGNLTKLLMVDPIRTLSQVDKLGKTDEVLSIAKRTFHGRQIFHLIDMLAISRRVIERSKIISGPKIPRQTINKRQLVFGPTAHPATYIQSLESGAIVRKLVPQIIGKRGRKRHKTLDQYQHEFEFRQND